jgi:cell division protein FtsA
MHEKLFALDIGTRSVVGIIIEKQLNHFEVIDVYSIEHKERAMLDGQIHDIPAVSKVIEKVKNQLEKSHGPLRNVSVAAAGRALKTERSTFSMDIKGKSMVHDDILHLELSAVQQAQALVAEKNASQTSYHYYCVGYSVLFYKLDDQEIGSLIDQNGDEASVEIIATFLPKVVVESLLAALKRAGLHMQGLTLEPIAAINVLIPQSMRRLNVALVDIGAGTSDIAITDSGTVTAYGMVPVAGDEITEAISDSLLLDFPLAEQAKRQLVNQETITVTDILGFEAELMKQEVIESIYPSLEKLAESISEEIFALNHTKSPKAVMLVGGGSLTPELPGLLATKLQLPPNRVAIRGIDAIQDVTISKSIQSGPELVTPIGIAIAAHKNPIQYMSVTVNGETVRLFEMKQLTVGDCLLTAGIKLTTLYGKPGMAIMVTFNKQLITIPGQHGTKPVITLNGKEVSLDDPIQNDDVIAVKQGIDGLDATAMIEDLTDSIPRKRINIENIMYTVKPRILRNGEEVSGNELLEDRDQIECELPNTIKELLTHLQLTHFLEQLKPFSVKVNQKNVIIPKYSMKILKNGLLAKPESSYEDGDRISFNQPVQPLVSDLAHAIGAQLTYSLPVSFNGKQIILAKPLAEFQRHGEILSHDELILFDDDISFIQHKMEPFIFQDIFRHVEIEMPSQSTGRFILLNNNRETSFDGTLSPGDELTILWPTKAIRNKR